MEHVQIYNTKPSLLMFLIPKDEETIRVELKGQASTPVSKEDYESLNKDKTVDALRFQKLKKKEIIKIVKDTQTLEASRSEMEAEAQETVKKAAKQAEEIREKAKEEAEHIKKLLDQQFSDFFNHALKPLVDRISAIEKTIDGLKSLELDKEALNPVMEILGPISEKLLHKDLFKPVLDEIKNVPGEVAKKIKTGK